MAVTGWKALNARYDPPLGKLGDLLDPAVMHRVAQATMRDFLERLAGRLEAELGLSSTSSSRTGAR